MTIKEAVNERHSVRQYKNIPIEKETEKELGHSIISPNNFLPKGETPDLLPGEDDHTNEDAPKKKKR